MMAGGFNTEGLWRSLRIAVTALTVVFLVAPMLIVLIISFSSAPFLMFPPPGLSLQWYRKLFGDPAWSDSLITSLEIVIPTGLLAMTVGTAAAHRSASGSLATTRSAWWSAASDIARSIAPGSSGLGKATVGKSGSGCSCCSTTQGVWKPAVSSTWSTGAAPTPCSGV